MSGTDSVAIVFDILLGVFFCVRSTRSPVDGGSVLLNPDGRQGKLVTALRTEVAGARSCFREMSEKGVALAVTATGAILGLIATIDSPAPAFAAIGIVFLLMAVQRMGIHKFSTANRLLGYQLHLERLGDGGHRLASMGWEEALRAWRSLQPTLFSRLYRTPNNSFTKLPLVCDLLLWRVFLHKPEFEAEIERAKSYIKNPNYKREALSSLWWMQAERAELADGKYHAGSYLERMFTILAIAQVFALAPLGLVVAERVRLQPNALGVAGWGAAVALVLLLACFALNWRSLSRRRAMLERELLSIQSCAIVWKVVSLAHDLAWTRAGEKERREYTERLAYIGSWLRDEFYEIRRHSDLPRFPDEMAKPKPNRTSKIDDFPSGIDENRIEPRSMCVGDTGRDVMCGINGQRIACILMDCSRDGCRVRPTVPIHGPVTRGLPVIIEVLPGRPLHPSPTALDRLGRCTRTGTVAWTLDMAPGADIGVHFQ